MGKGKFLQNMDIFGQDIKLNMKGTHKISSRFGGLMTITAIVFTFIMASSIIKDALYRLNPQFTKSSAIVPDPGFLNFNSSNFVFALRLQDSRWDPNSTNIALTMKLCHYTRYPNGTLIKIRTQIPPKT